MTDLPNWALLADLHFNNNDRSRLKITSDWICDDIKANNCKHIFILGDTLHSRCTIENAAQNAVKDFLSNLLDLPSSPTIWILIGNHDMDGKEDRTINSLSPFAVDSNRIRVLSEIELVKIAEGPDGQTQDVLFIPYHHDQSEIVQWVNNNLPTNEERSNIIALMHAEVEGALKIGYTTSHTLRKKPQYVNKSSLTVDWLSLFKRVFTGHFHRHATYGEKQNITYVGSPMQVSFSDANDINKGYILYQHNKDIFKLNINPHAVLYETIDMESAIKFRTYTLEELQNIGLPNPTKFKNKRVLLTVPYDSKQIDISDISEYLKKEFDLEKLRVFYETPPARIKTIKVEEKQNIQPDDIIDLVSSYIDQYKNIKLPLSKEELNTARDLMITYLNSVANNTQSNSGSTPIFRSGLSTLTMSNFIGIVGTRKFDFNKFPDGICLIKGKNGAGKSTILDAIVWCLFGKHFRTGAHAEDVLNKFVKREVCSVSVTFTCGTNITRRRVQGSNKSGIDLILVLPNGEIINKGTSTETQKEINTHLGTDWKTFAHTVVLSSNSAVNFINSKTDERKILFEQLFGFYCFEDYLLYWKFERSTNDQKLKELENQKKDLQHQINIRGENITSMQKIDEQRIKQIEQNYVKRENELDNAINKCSIKISQLENKISILESKKKQLLASHESMVLKKSEDHKQTIDEHNNRINILKSSIIKLSDTESDYQIQISKLDDIISSLESINDNYETTTREHEQNIDKLNGLINSKEQEIQKIKKQFQIESIIYVIKQVINKMKDESCKDIVIDPLQDLVNTYGSTDTNEFHIKENEIELLYKSIQKELSSSIVSKNEAQTYLAQARIFMLDKIFKSHYDIYSECQMKDPSVVVLMIIRQKTKEKKDLRVSLEFIQKEKELKQKEIELLQTKLMTISMNMNKQIPIPHDSIDDLVNQIQVLTTERIIQQTEKGFHFDELNLIPSKLENELQELNNIHENKSQLEIIQIRTLINQLSQSIEDIDTTTLNYKHQNIINNFWISSLGGCNKDTTIESNLRAFCLNRDLQHFNTILAKNNNILSEDANGIVHVDDFKLDFKLTPTLEIVINESKNVAMKSRSSGQAKRADLSLFFSLFTLAQHRSSWQSNFIFLDEVFDSLDFDGQYCVQRWLSQYLMDESNNTKIVFLVSHSSHVDMYNISSVINVVKGEYTLEYGLMPNMTNPAIYSYPNNQQTDITKSKKLNQTKVLKAKDVKDVKDVKVKDITKVTKTRVKRVAEEPYGQDDTDYADADQDNSKKHKKFVDDDDDKPKMKKKKLTDAAYFTEIAKNAVLKLRLKK